MRDEIMGTIAGQECGSICSPITQRHPIQNDVIMFITTNIYGGEPIFENDAYAREAIEELYRVRNMRPFCSTFT